MTEGSVYYLFNRVKISRIVHVMVITFSLTSAVV